MINRDETQKPLQGKIAFITGASRGIGGAIARRVARDGAHVVVHFHSNESAAQQVVEDIEGLAGTAELLHANLSDINDVRRLWQEFDQRVPGLDILVNNAGGATFEALASVNEADFDAIFSLNVRGLFFNTQEAIQRLRDGGRIINISSGITRVNAAGASVYAGSKAAVEAFTRCWAAELGPRQITVNTLSPGMTQTDLLASVTSQEILDQMVQQTPLGRLGQPEDIADAVAFLCSDQARWITANNLLANGGAA